MTILARGDAGGLALYGSEDRALTSQQHLHERMVVAMAGPRRRADPLRHHLLGRRQRPRAGEPHGPRGRGAAGLLAAGRPDRLVLRAPPESRSSGETRRAIDEEIGRMVDAAYADAVALLTTTATSSTPSARRSSTREQVDRAEIEEILAAPSTGGGRRLPPRADALPTAAGRPPSGPPLPVPPVPGRSPRAGARRAAAGAAGAAGVRAPAAAACAPGSRRPPRRSTRSPSPGWADAAARAASAPGSPSRPPAASRGRPRRGDPARRRGTRPAPPPRPSPPG